MLIVMSGLPATGKTTIARELARQLSAVYLRIDSIEQGLRNAGCSVRSEGYDVARALALDNLRLGRVVIADCVNPWPLTRNDWHETARKAQVSVFDIEVVCSNAEEHRRRVESRVPDIENHQLPSWQDVMDRDYRPWETPRLVVDTATSSAPEAVQKILQSLPRD